MSTPDLPIFIASGHSEYASNPVNENPLHQEMLVSLDIAEEKLYQLIPALATIAPQILSEPRVYAPDPKVTWIEQGISTPTKSNPSAEISIHGTYILNEGHSATINMIASQRYPDQSHLYLLSHLKFFTQDIKSADLDIFYRPDISIDSFDRLIINTSNIPPTRTENPDNLLESIGFNPQELNLPYCRAIIAAFADGTLSQFSDIQNVFSALTSLTPIT